MVIIGEEEIKEVNADVLAIRIFLKAIELIGGPKKIIEYRKLTWIPSLIQAAYAIVLYEEFGKLYEEIAEKLGLTKQTVQNMLRASADAVKEKLGEFEKGKEIKVHTAGGLAKWAYEEIKKGNESISFLSSVFEHASEFFEISWPIEVLKRIKGHKFPITKDEIAELLKGLKIDEKPIDEIVNKLSEKINSPSHLLKLLKEKSYER